MTYYPNLRIDLPGTPGAVHAVIESMTNATRELEASARRLQSALDFAGTWDGAAADSYTSAGSDLVPALNSGVHSLAIAGTALETWVAQLADNQRLAEQWERQAAALASQEAVFLGQYQAAFAAIRPGTYPSGYDPSRLGGDGIEGETPALAAAYERWEKADSAVNELRIKAEALAQKHTSQANAAATKVEAAKPNAFEPATHPSLVQSVVNDVTSVAGKLAQWSATVTAIAAPIPGIDLIDAVTGPLAAGAGAVHLAGDAEQVITHAPGSSVLNFVLDAVDAHGGRTAIEEIGGLRQAGRDSSSLAGAARAYTDGKHIAAAGNPTLTRAQQVARGRAAARRPAIAAAAQLPVQAAGGPPLAKDGVGVLLNPSAKSVGALLENQARGLDQRHNR
ncbi:MAG TPA: hypothetical protein VHV74_17565 [Pseudonocardiaceae bacterium]|jgi:hypothetical protein|nr:hypothetical protein [Pseudonocardiaceae bacterium]